MDTQPTLPDASKIIVTGVFTDRALAFTAIDELHEAGFREEDIGYIRRDRHQDNVFEPETKATEGLATGALTGGVIGGLIAAAGSLLIPGIGPVIAGGLLLTTLGGAVVGATAGGILGTLVGLGVPESEAQFYEEEVSAGGTLITVRAGDRAEEAATILRRNGAYDAATRAPTPADIAAEENVDDLPVPQDDDRRSGRDA